MPMSADTSGRRHSVLSSRREWSLSEKREIVAETRATGANVSAVARRHSVAQSQIYQWRKAFPLAGSDLTFLPVSVAAPMLAPEPPAAEKPSLMIEIELAFGRKLRVASDIDTAALRKIIVALETA